MREREHGPAHDWTWAYEGYDPAREQVREALCTLGNGCFATRGAAPECPAGPVHYPGTYAAGCYDTLGSTVAGRQVENEDLVNLPNWLPLRFRFLRAGDRDFLRAGDGDTRAGAADGGPEPWLSPDSPALVEHRQWLDLRGGILEREARFRGADGRCLSVRQTRLVSMADPHLALLRTRFTAEGWAGDMEVEAGLDGTVRNSGVARYRQLDGRHLTRVRGGAADGGDLWLGCRTRTSGIRIALASRVVVREDPPAAVPARSVAGTRVRQAGRYVARVLRLRLAPGRTVTVDKTVALHTSRDATVGDPTRACLDRLARTPGADGVLGAHRDAWELLWRRGELTVPGEAGRVLRLHLFHVLQTLSPHTAGLDAGVPARGLHGEAYRGHVFWDELFVLPYLNLRFPEVSRALLDYRHRRLEAACDAARASGLRGAMYPWQSGGDGREQTQRLHLNPRSGRWLPDHTHLQHHVGSAVAYNVWQYCEASGDTAYLHTRGAEMLVRIARFWASLASYDPGLDRYRVRGVVGPDEYHDGYPGASSPGLDDNAYTNVTAAWVLARTLGLLRALPAPRRRELLYAEGLLDDSERSELARWDEISRRLYVPFHEGVVSQFAGYDALAELDWEDYRKRYGDIRRLDRILEAEGDTVNRYRASKQADVLMLGYLFSAPELHGLFRRLGYPVDADVWRRTVDFYLCRTSHGSTLSGLVHGWVLARVRRGEAWRYCQEALAGDIADVQGGTTGEGIHLGAMAGTLDLVQRGLTGLEPGDGVLRLDPVPLPEISEYGFRIRYRGHWGVGLSLRAGELRMAVPASRLGPIVVELPDRTVTVAPGETCRLTLVGHGPPSGRAGPEA